MESALARSWAQNRWVLSAIFVGLSIYVLISFSITISNTLSRTGGTDLFTYWRINHFIRQGEDPYKAFLAKSEIRLPVKYINGHVVTSHPLAETDEEQKLPGNSPPVLFLLLPLSFLSWTTAKVVWLIVSISLVLATPWLVFRLIPDRLGLVVSMFVALIYYGFPGTRAAIVTGQTGVLAIFLVILAFKLTQNNRNWLAGLALAIALSKFTVAIPLVLLLLYKRNWQTLIIAGVGQAASFIAIAFLREGSPFAVFYDFATISGKHAPLIGIHLTGLFNPTTLATILVAVVFSTAVLILFLPLVLRLKEQELLANVRDFTAFSVACLWGLLVVYHRGYDIGMALPIFILIIHVLNTPTIWNISIRRKNQLFALLMLNVAVISLPVRFVENVLGTWWESFVTGSITVVLVIVLLAVLLLCKNLERSVLHGISPR